MDRAVELPLQGSELWPVRHSCKRKSHGNLFGCLLAFCLLAVFLLALPVFYLLSRNLREPLACKTEERAGGMPEAQKLTGTSPELKPRVHMKVLNKKNVTYVAGQKYPALQWNNDDEPVRSNAKVKIKYENGFLVIPKPGDYFVYAQVTFRNQSTEKDNCDTDSKEVTHVIQMISKISNSYPEPMVLLKSSRSIRKTQNWNHAIYLGGIATLKENDKLCVSVSDAKLVFDKAMVNFFGAFLI